MRYLTHLVIIILFFISCSKEKNSKLLYGEYGSGIKYEISVIDDSMFHGLYTEYYPNSKMRTSILFIKDKAYGPTIIYYENEKVESIFTYWNHQVFGWKYNFDTNGILQNKEYYKKGIIDGPVLYYKSGILNKFEYVVKDTIYFSSEYNMDSVMNIKGHLLKNYSYRIEHDTVELYVDFIKPPNYKIELQTCKYLDENWYCNKLSSKNFLKIRINKDRFPFVLLITGKVNEQNLYFPLRFELNKDQINYFTLHDTTYIIEKRPTTEVYKQ